MKFNHPSLRKLSQLCRPLLEAAKSLFSFAPFLVYLAAVVTVIAQLWIFETWIYEINPWMYLDFVELLADVMLAMMPFVWLRGRWRMTIWIPIVGITIFCYVNLWYCRAFYDLMPLETVGMAGNMEGAVVDAFFDMVQPLDWLMVVPPLVFAAVVILLRKKWLKGRFSKKWMIGVPVASVLMWGIAYTYRAWTYHQYYRSEEPYADTWCRYFEITKSDSYKFTQHLRRMGYVGYCLWQLDNTFNSRKISAEEKAEIEKFWAEQRQNRSGVAAEYAHNRDKNLIFVIVESLSADAIGRTINGVEITPYLTALFEGDSTAIVALQVIPQTNHGRSSDGQFIYNTGLLPLRNNVVAKRFPSADYPSIAKAIGYPYRFEVIGERPTFYNHSTTNLSYGYTKLCATTTDKWLGDDRQIFDLAQKSIAEAKAPFYCEITTLSLHDPYNKGLRSPTAISDAEGYDPRDLNYFERAHELDEDLGNFLEALKANGIYDNSVIIIASDHEPRKSCLGPDLITNNIVFAALNTGRPGTKIDRIVGQVDAFPTILDIMGITDYKYPGLGKSMLTPEPPQGAIDAFGEEFGAPAAPYRQRLQQAWRLSEIMIEAHYY